MTLRDTEKIRVDSEVKLLSNALRPSCSLPFGQLHEMVSNSLHKLAEDLFLSWMEEDTPPMSEESLPPHKEFGDVLEPNVEEINK